MSGQRDATLPCVSMVPPITPAGLGCVLSLSDGLPAGCPSPSVAPCPRLRYTTKTDQTPHMALMKALQWNKSEQGRSGLEPQWEGEQNLHWVEDRQSRIPPTVSRFTSLTLHAHILEIVTTLIFPSFHLTVLDGETAFK